MANKSQNKLNQPPTGQGKKQSPLLGEPMKLTKRSEVLQSTNAEQNIVIAEEEEAARAPATMLNPKRAKAGR
jgi:hypothetical protein